MNQAIPTLFGIEHLTRSNDGYVYWKGTCVEHYSHREPESMKQAAIELARVCRALESKGFEVNWRSSVDPLYLNAPADTPWKQALYRFYTFFEGNGRHVAVFYRFADPEVVVLEKCKETGEVKKTFMDSAYEAFHFVQNQGLTSGSPYSEYARFSGFLEASGLTPEVIAAALT